MRQHARKDKPKINRVFFLSWRDLFFLNQTPAFLKKFGESLKENALLQTGGKADVTMVSRGRIWLHVASQASISLSVELAIVCLPFLAEL